MKHILLTKLQAEELRDRIITRNDTVEGDPESGDEFENSPGALDDLLAKLSPPNFVILSTHSSTR